MLKTAVNKYSSSAATKTQQPLQSRVIAPNSQKSEQPRKRKFDRSLSTTSNLSALHESSVYIDENDFDDTIDLTDSPPLKKAQAVDYPSLRNVFEDVSYPQLPAVANSAKRQPQPTSSAPIPWSSSPPEHHQRPVRKRRTVPWLDKAEQDEEAASIPVPMNGHSTPGGRQLYPWTKTASALKDEQKELRKRNKMRSVKPSTTGVGASVENINAKISQVFLSDEQKGVLRSVVEDGKSVFFTGSAGTGKSVLMRQIIAQLKRKYSREPDRVAVTASTGLAACNIEGITLHSFSGIGLGKEPAPELVKKIKRNAKHKQRWLRTKVLIVDEVSMVDGDLWDKLEHVARALRNNGRPFGGMQIVVTGDFFQLPPVPDANRAAKFAFDAQTWNTVVEHTILLTHVFRQRDPAFAGMLNEMRLGKLTQASINEFKKLERDVNYKDELSATELFPTRNEVDNANNVRMKRLSGEIMTFTAVDTGIANEEQRERALQYFMAPKEVKLKKGAQVMLIKNVDSQLVNGTLGKVVAFMDETYYRFYDKHEDEYHLANGSVGDPEDVAKAKKRLNEFVAREGSVGAQKLPLVRFKLADNTSRDVLVEYEDWKQELPNGEILAQRKQLPLILAWALSIHKAQGQTLERVKVDLGKVFEKGQAYVALSRAVSKEGLQVTRFDARKVMVHPKVVEFYDKLVSIDSVLNSSKAGGKKAITVQDYEHDFFEVDDEEAEQYMYG